MARTAVLESRCSVCMRTARVISGRVDRPGCGDGNPVPYSVIQCRVEMNEIRGSDRRRQRRTLALSAAGNRALVNGKVAAYPFPGTAGTFVPSDCSGIAKADSGSAHRRRAWCMYIGEEPMSSPRPTAFPATPLKASSKIGRVTFGSRTSNGLDRFRDVPIPAISFLQGSVSRPPWGRSLRRRMAASGSATFDGLDRWENGQVTIYRKRRSPRDLLDSDVGRAEVIDPGLPDDSWHLSTAMNAGESGFVSAQDSLSRGWPVRPGSLAARRNCERHRRRRRGNLWVANQQLGLFHWSSRRGGTDSLGEAGARRMARALLR